MGPLLTGAADFLKSGQRAGCGESMPSVSQSSPARSPRPLCTLKELKEGGGAFAAAGGHQIKDCLGKGNPYIPADMLQGRAAVQVDLDRVEEWAHRSLMAFEEDKWQALHLGRKNVLRQYRLGTELCYDLRAHRPPLGRSARGGRVSTGERVGGWKGTDAQASSSWPRRRGCGEELS